MRNLNKYAADCMAQLDSIGIQYGNVTEFTVNTRAKKRWGQCSRKPDNTYTIDISFLLLDERNSEEGLKNTIIHELLHSCEGCMNHGAKWQALASKVNRVYGYHISRCSSREEVGVKDETLPISFTTHKYALRCKECGKVYERDRMCDAVRFPELYKCGCCKGSLERIR